MNYTTIEQSKKLVELGLDPKTADMYYKQEIGRKDDMPYYTVEVGHSFSIEQNLFSFRNGLEIPCWSLGALTNLMPDTLSIGTKTYCLWINSSSCGYYRMKQNLPVSGDCLCSYFKYNGNSPIYDCFKYLLENNYIKKGGTK